MFTVNMKNVMSSVSLIILFSFFSNTECFNIDLSKTKTFNYERDSYFGYSVLLQKGSVPQVIVGAPNEQGGSILTCHLDIEKCDSYYIKTRSINNTNFLGSVLVGDNYVGGRLYTCAPNTIRIVKTDAYYLNGECYGISNSSSLRGSVRRIVPLEAISALGYNGNKLHYNAAFGQAGFDVYYSKVENKLLFGAPGLKSWRGGMVDQDLETQNVLNLYAPLTLEEISYMGYRIITGNFTGKSLNYVISAPRANKLTGKVLILEHNKFGRLTLKSNINGEEIGSYFGYSLLADDINNDFMDDVFIGAPMLGGQTWEEGCVYFFKNNVGYFDRPVKLLGSSKSGGRFGMAISSLDDIDLDGYRDVAISAPYEDGGIGTVYIYRGSRSGLKNEYSQKLSPLLFDKAIPTMVRGFGISVSGGIDIDRNGHTDMAVGAYLSNQVFVFISSTILNFKARLSASPITLKIESKNFLVEYCVSYTVRNKINQIFKARFKTNLTLDDRSSDLKNIFREIDVSSAEEHCVNTTVNLKKISRDISPFFIGLHTTVSQEGVTGIGDDYVEKWISFSRGCGEDDICQPELSVVAQTYNRTEIMVGLDDLIEIVAYVKNTGEPAFDCVLEIKVPETMELRDLRDCNYHNDSYLCPLENIFTSVKKIFFKFDTIQIPLSTRNYIIDFSVGSLGLDKVPENNKYSLKIPITIQNRPYIEGHSLPEDLTYQEVPDASKYDRDLEHRYSLGNMGPSPLKPSIRLYLPFEKDHSNIISKIDFEGSLNDMELSCNAPAESDYLISPIVIKNKLEVPLNRTILVGCFKSGEDCMEVLCDGDYLLKSEAVILSVKMRLNLKALVSKLQQTKTNKDIIAFVSTAVVFNETTTLNSHVITIFYGPNTEPEMPLWLYIISVFVGLLLFLLVTLILYKCNFFNRTYKERMKNEENLLEKSSSEVH